VRLSLALAAALAAHSLSLTPTAGSQTADSQRQVVKDLAGEAASRSEVMEIARELTDIYGPRLTGSPHLRAAAERVVGRLKRWGVQNARVERWGPVGPGWTTDRFVALVVSPVPFALHAFPKAWTPGTAGALVGEAAMAVIRDESDLDKYRGRLRDKFVLTAPPVDSASHAPVPTGRYSTEQLSAMKRHDAQPVPDATTSATANLEFIRRRMAFFIEQGVAALLEPGGDSGAVVVTDGRLRDDAAFGGKGFYPWPDAVATQIVVASDHYNRIARMLQSDVPVTIEMNVANTYHTAEPDAFNIIAEIPGTDRAQEVVMLGAHFDSWHAATGATDNAAGSAVMLEALRILTATGLKARRTIRVALWTGTEQGWLGSRSYVTEHFADPAVMELKPAHPLLSAYFNLDRGGGAIRGIYLQGNESAGRTLEPWLEAVEEHGAATLSPWTTRDGDHRSFEAVGIPGFDFIQDPLDFESRTRHTSADTFDRLHEADLITNAALVASLAYYVANHERPLPRKPLPKPDASAAGPWSPGR
jgi:hypothetical protein